MTAGNASGINDGAAALARHDGAEGARARARSRSRHRVLRLDGRRSEGHGHRTGVGGAQGAANAPGLELTDIDLFELNEAFAAQSVAVARELGLEPTRINRHGGAIALGHPIGASGGRILVTLLHEMKRSNIHRGLATLCVGGGQGQAAVIRNGD